MSSLRRRPQIGTLIWPTIASGNVSDDDIAASVADLAAAGMDAVKLYVNLTLEQIAVAVRRGCAPTTCRCSPGPRRRGAMPDPGRVGPIGSHERCRLSARHDGGVGAPGDQLCLRFPRRGGNTGERLARQASVVVTKEAMAEMHAAGCTVIAGSDAPWPGLIPGFALHDELALLVDAGLSATDALITATSTVADLLVVEGDPTRDITDLAHVRQVVRMGPVVEEGALRNAAVRAFERAPTDFVSRMILEVAGPD